MKVVFLGTGTSTGVPVIGCQCAVCRSPDPANARHRSSLLLQKNGRNLVIDTGPEFRVQALRAGLGALDAVLYTHVHADHVLGLDDLRPLSYQHGLDAYCEPSAKAALKKLFPYVFSKKRIVTTKPKLRFHSLRVGKAQKLAGFEVTPLRIFHGKAPILGYRVENLAYLTDCSFIPDATRGLLQGIEVLVVGALRTTVHPTHFNVDQALEASRSLGAPRTYLTHLSHELEHQSLAQSLPEGVEPAFDQLCLEL